MALQNKFLQAIGSKGNHAFNLYITEHSTDIATNTSNIGFKFELAAINNGWDWHYGESNAPVSWSITIAGNTYSGSIPSYDGSSTVTLKEGTFNVTHNTDGYKSISYSISVTSSNLSYVTGNASASDTMALSWIARKAILTEANGFNDEENPTIKYKNAAGNAVHKIMVCIASPDAKIAYTSYKELTKTGTSYTFNLTDAERNTLRAAVTSGNTMKFRYFLRTYFDSEYFEVEQSYEKTFTLINYLPTLNPTFEDVNSNTLSLTGGASTIVKGYSNISYAVNALGQKGATIKSYSVTCGGVKKTTATGTFTGATSNQLVFTVTDSRGNTATKTLYGYLIDYVKLTCNLTTATPDTSGNLKFTISGNFFNDSFGGTNNYLGVAYKIKENDGDFGGWYELVATRSGNTYSVDVSLSGLNYQSTYTIQARALDALLTVDSAAVAVKTTPVFDWGKDGFNFNVPISINDEPIVDYIVERGTSGIWTYEKWHSGKAVCYGNYNVGAKTVIAWDTLWETGGIGAPALPSGLFIETPVIIANVNSSGGFSGWIAKGTTPPSKTSVGTYTVVRPTQANFGVLVLSYYMIGRWK